MRRLVQWAAAASLLCILIIVSPARAQEPTPPTLLPTDYSLVQRTYELITQARARRSLSPYRWNESLTIAAQLQAEWLVQRRARQHFRADGSGPLARAVAAGFVPVGWCCGENFYMSIDATPEFVVNWWVGSVNHVVNIFHREYTDIGVGVASDGWLTAYVTVFGRMADPNITEPIPP
jgi:uncharacterized protein YkwD